MNNCVVKVIRFTPDPSIGEWVVCGVVGTNPRGEAILMPMPENVANAVWPDDIDGDAAFKTAQVALVAFDTGIKKIAERTGSVSMDEIELLNKDCGLSISFGPPQFGSPEDLPLMMEILARRVVRSGSPAPRRWVPNERPAKHQLNPSLAREPKDDYPRSTSSGPIVTNP